MNVLNEIGYHLIKTDNEISYNDGTGKHTDFIPSINNLNYGTLITRALTYPYGNSYTIEMANNLLTNKLTDIQLA